MSRFRCCVVVISYNSSVYLRSCLGSLIASMHDDDEIVVLDNASQDGSVALIRDEFPTVRLICEEVNHGFAGGMNRVAQLCDAEYFIGVNPDVVARPDWLDELIAPFDWPGENRFLMTTARIVMLGRDDIINACGNVVHLTGVTTCRGLGKPALDQEFSRVTAVAAISGACFAIRLADWRTLGGFDEVFFTYYEDTDLSLRARLYGGQILYVPNAVVAHDYRDTFSERKLYYLERNRLIMILKVYPTAALLALLPALLIGETLSWAYALYRGLPGLRSKTAAASWILRNAMDLLASRRAVQRRRVRRAAEWIAELSVALPVAQLLPKSLNGIGVVLTTIFAGLKAVALASVSLLSRSS